MALTSNTYTVKWLEDARLDLESALNYASSTYGEAAAKKLAQRIFNAVDAIASNPSISKPGRVAGTREKPVKDTSFLIPFQVKDNEIQILRVFHTSRKPPATNW